MAVIQDTKRGRTQTHPSPPKKSVDLSLLVKKIIEGDDPSHVYDIVKELASLPTTEYAKYKTQLKSHFGSRLPSVDLDRAVKDARPKSATRTPESELSEDAIFLTDTASVKLYYDPKIGYIAVGKARSRVLLGASVQFERYATGDDMDAPRAFIEVHFSKPGTSTRVATLRLSRPMAKDLKCWQNLEGKIINLPIDEKDSMLAYAAISTHAAMEVDAKHLVLQILKSSYGWHSYQDKKYYVRANGCIDGDSLYYDHHSPLTVQAPKSVLQRLPQKDTLNLVDVDGQVLIDLLNFWQDNGPKYFPLAMFFSCARIMLPDIENAGRVDWQLELFGKTSLLKTAVINYFLATFFGDYTHDSPTEMTDSKVGDTGVGTIYKEARLQYVAYQDVDYRYKPGHPLYEKYQDRRLASLGKTRNKAGGGERGKSRGEGSETRPDGGGLLIRTGEVNPHEYSIAQCDDESTDAGACTFLFFGDSNIKKEDRLSLSISIEERRTHLQAIGILWTQWLAKMTPETTISLYRKYATDADTFIANITKKHQHKHIHLRVFNWLKDMLVGGYFFTHFLKESGIEHAKEIYLHIGKNLNGFVTERLQVAEKLASDYAENRGGATQQDSLANKISDAIYTAVLEGKAHFSNKDGKIPVTKQVNASTPKDTPDTINSPKELGYKEIRVDENEWQAGGIQLGIITTDYLYINPKMFHPFISKHIKLKSCPSRLDCLKALEQANVLVTSIEASKKQYASARIVGGGPRYLKIRTDFLYGDEDATKQTPDSEVEDFDVDELPD